MCVSGAVCRLAEHLQAWSAVLQPPQALWWRPGRLVAWLVERRDACAACRYVVMRVSAWQPRCHAATQYASQLIAAWAQWNKRRLSYDNAKTCRCKVSQIAVLAVICAAECRNDARGGDLIGYCATDAPEPALHPGKELRKRHAAYQLERHMRVAQLAAPLRPRCTCFLCKDREASATVPRTRIKLVYAAGGVQSWPNCHLCSNARAEQSHLG